MKLARRLSSTASACALLASLTAPAAAWAQDASPAPSPRAPMPPPPTIEVTPDRVSSGAAVRVVVYGAVGQVELYAADQPGGPYTRIRTGQVADRKVEWEIFPDRHKTIYAKQTDEGTANGGMSNPADIRVTAVLSIDARRLDVRDYSFYGQVRPAPGNESALISLYRIEPATSRSVLTARARPGANGRYEIRRQFTGTGRFGFFATVSATAAADAGRSRVRPTVIH